MGTQRPRPVVLDAGGLIAVERSDRRVVRLLELAQDVYVPSAVVAQVWRNPVRQVRLVRVLAAESVTLVPLDGVEARAVGQLCAATGTADIADVSVALVGRRTGGVVVTGHPDDLRRLDPGLDLVVC